MDSLTNQIQDADKQLREMEYAHVSMDLEEIQKLKDEKRALEGEKKTKHKNRSHSYRKTQYNTIQYKKKSQNFGMTPGSSTNT